MGVVIPRWFIVASSVTLVLIYKCSAFLRLYLNLFPHRFKYTVQNGAKVCLHMELKQSAFSHKQTFNINLVLYLRQGSLGFSLEFRDCLQ